jgi:hypothetical protein
MDKIKKILVSYRFTPTTIKLIDILATKLQISKTAIVSLAIIRFAEQENVKVEDEAG